MGIVKARLTRKKIQAVRCPTCGAARGKKCELITGQPRTPHRDRRLIAADLVLLTEHCSTTEMEIGCELETLGLSHIVRAQNPQPRL